MIVGRLSHVGLVLLMVCTVNTQGQAVNLNQTNAHRQSICGDSLFAANEQCDDGNVVDGDGCSATCQIEQPDWVCTDPNITPDDVIQKKMADAIVEGSLEDNRGRQSYAWAQYRSSLNDGLPICSEVHCSFPGDLAGNGYGASEGAFFALFGVGIGPTDSAIYQDVTIPTTATVLQFDMLVGVCDSPDDEFRVNIDGTAVFIHSCNEATTTYETQSVDISLFADGSLHTLDVRATTFSTNGGNSHFLIDQISIPLLTPIIPVPSSCTLLTQACYTVETFDAGISHWSVINLSPNDEDGWGVTDDEICLSQNAHPLASQGPNLTTGGGVAACADSGATGQMDKNAGSVPSEMNTYLCSPAFDFSLISNPYLTFNTNYQTANNSLNDNGTPNDDSDDFDDDILELVVGTVTPTAESIINYAAVSLVVDHKQSDLTRTGAQELQANLAGSALEGSSEGYVCFRYQATFAWLAQIDNVALRGDDCNLAPVDSDGDGVFDSTDNCTVRPNPTQYDSNQDGIGNACDGDIDNNCVVAFLDFAPVTYTFMSSAGDPNFDPDRDFNGDNVINFLDMYLFQEQFGGPPGPSANNPCAPD